MADKHTIMIVDDNAVNLKLAGDVLEIEGFNVLRCSNAEAALIRLGEKRPDLVLMDIALPGMSGLELTQLIKNDPEMSGIKVVALTAFAMKGDEEKILAAGCDGYITKPIDTRKFVSQIIPFLSDHERA